MNSIHQSSSIVHTKIYSSAITTYTYNARGQQTGYSKGGVSASYTYLPTGLRKSKTVGFTTTNFVWDGQNMVYGYINDQN